MIQPSECVAGTWYDCNQLEANGLPGLINKGKVLCCENKCPEEEMPAFAFHVIHSSFASGVWKDLPPVLEIFYLEDGVDESDPKNQMNYSPIQGWCNENS